MQKVAPAIDVQRPLSLEQQIKSLLMQELEGQHDTPATGHQGRLDNSESHAGKGTILIINDKPGIGSLAGQWLAQGKYCYTFVRNEDEAKAFLKGEHVDALMRSSEFLFP